jgi:DNA-binding MarR family transcriptional regulator
MARTENRSTARAATTRAGGIRRRTGEGGVPQLDRLVHERVRLGILSALAVNDALTFTDLKQLLQTTDGNLSVHARKLEEAEYVACTKSFDGRLPRTEYRLLPKGRDALDRYLDRMETFIRQAKGARDR